MTGNDAQRLADLGYRASKLSHAIHPQADGRGFYLSNTWPGHRDDVILGRTEGVTLDAIEKKIKELEGGTFWWVKRLTWPLILVTVIGIIVGAVVLIGEPSRFN